MKQYQFADRLNQAIVDGILQGYKNYLLEKQHKKKTMKISSAYAWVRNNHMDDQVATMCEEMGYQYAQAMAGSSWRYLQFIHEEKRTMFIVKNESYLQQKNISVEQHLDLLKDIEEDRSHYLYRLAQINQDVQFSKTEQLSLPLNDNVDLYATEKKRTDVIDQELKFLQEKLDLFYIVSYEFNRQGFIAMVQLLLPSPLDGQAYIVEDLTHYISRSSVDFSELNPLEIEGEEETLGVLTDREWL